MKVTQKRFFHVFVMFDYASEFFKFVYLEKAQKLHIHTNFSPFSVLKMFCYAVNSYLNCIKCYIVFGVAEKGGLEF